MFLCCFNNKAILNDQKKKRGMAIMTENRSKIHKGRDFCIECRKELLSLVFGFDEVMIPRYLEGQVPSKEYSDVIRAVLVSPAYMKQKLTENRGKLTGASYKKAMTVAGANLISDDSLQESGMIYFANSSTKVLREAQAVFTGKAERLGL